MQARVFPTAIDNSMRSVFRACPTQFYNQYILRRISPVTPIDLHAGKAFASGVEETRRSFYENGMSEEDAIMRGVRALIDSYGEYATAQSDVKTVERMSGALEFYFQTFRLGGDFVKPFVFNDRAMIECSFAIPLDILHPVTNEPIIYFGRFDMVGITGSGDIYIVDEKTTSQLGPTWGRRYDLSAQFTGYVWAMQQYGISADTILIRGISILKDSYGKAQHIMFRPKHIVERWHAQLYRDVKEMIESWKHGEWGYDYSHSCGAFRGCSYAESCAMQDPEAWLLGSNFIDNTYAPLEGRQD